jgi:hypothetical protein
VTGETPDDYTRLAWLWRWLDYKTEINRAMEKR